MNTPTDKQISYILSLIDERHESAAYHEIATTMGCSATAAARRSTRRDASATIDRLTG